MGVSFFGPGSPYLGHPLLTEKRTAAEFDVIESLVGPVDRLHIADIGCGFGRHVVEAARRGAIVTAVDPSSAMVAATNERAAAADLQVVARVGRAEDLVAEHSGAVDLALCLFTTLGQRSIDANDPGGAGCDDALLRAATQLLRPGSPMLIEMPDRDRALAALITDETLGSTRVTRQFDSATSVLHEQFAIDGGATYELAVRLYDTQERRDLVGSAGLEIEHERPTGLAEPPPTLTTLLARRPS
ncbi:MAG: class I SAM-dependent methyltransferase [Actinomycetota bacterium]